MPIVSIIVPVYKVEKYIHRCVESLVNQTLRDIEIILVDDGSPDHCPEICEQLAKKDNRIKVVHKTNGGLSSARNAGMEVACGKYIGFVDSDDELELDMYEKMVAKAEKYRVDFVMADYIRIFANGKIQKVQQCIDGGLYNRERVIKDIFPMLIMKENIDYGPFLSVVVCLYRNSFLKENNLVFDEEVKWSEDNIFSAIMGYHCNNFYYMKGEALYHYYNNPGTITTSYRRGAWQVYSVMNEHLHAFFDTVTDYDFRRQMKLHMIYYASNCIGQKTSLPKEEAIRGIDAILKSEQLKSAFRSFKMPDVPIKLKTQLYLMKWRKSNWLYRLKIR